MNAALVYPEQHAGEFQLYVLSGSGPTSYSQATGDLILDPGKGNYVYAPMGAVLTQSGNYELKPFPASTGTLRPKWAWKWFTSGAGNPSGVNGVAITTAGTGGTNGTVTIASTGGGGTGATISVTTAGGIITAASVLTPGSGYTSVPTFTIAAGTGVVTATIGAVGGIEVATGANLSAEVVQFAALGGQI